MTCLGAQKVGLPHISRKKQKILTVSRPIGSTTVALGGTKKGKDGQVEVEVPTNEKDVNDVWLAMRKDLSVKSVEVEVKRSAEEKQADHMKSFRTNFVR